MISTEDTQFTFPSKGSLWIPLPVKAIKDLANTGNRPASRVLYALCLHLGKDLVAVFPSYKSIAWYACVGENSIRKCLNILEFKGYISIEKKRIGRKFENHYTILRKTWYPDLDVKLSIPIPGLDPNKEWICNTCWADVALDEERIPTKIHTHQGFKTIWLHKKCAGKGGSALLPATEQNRLRQAYKIHEIETKDERDAALERFNKEYRERERIKQEELRRIRQIEEAEFERLRLARIANSESSQ